MRKGFAPALLAAAMLPGLGCGSLQYVQKTPDGGVVAFKAGDEQATIEKLKREHGDIEVVGVYDPKAGSGAKPFDPTAPVKPSERVAASGPFGSLLASDDGNTMHIKFAKKPMGGVTPAGLPPAPKDDGLMQAGYKSSVSGYDRKPASSTALPTPNLGGPVQGVVDCTDGSCTTGK